VLENRSKPISQQEIDRLWKIRREGCFVDWDKVKSKFKK